MNTFIGILIVYVGILLAWMLPGFAEMDISPLYRLAHNLLIGIPTVIACMFFWRT